MQISHLLVLVHAQFVRTDGQADLWAVRTHHHHWSSRRGPSTPHNSQSLSGGLYHLCAIMFLKIHPQWTMGSQGRLYHKKRGVGGNGKVFSFVSMFDLTYIFELTHVFFPNLTQHCSGSSMGKDPAVREQSPCFSCSWSQFPFLAAPVKGFQVEDDVKEHPAAKCHSQSRQASACLTLDRTCRKQN